MEMLEYLKSMGKAAGRTVKDGAKTLVKMNEQRAEQSRLRNAMKKQEELAQREYVTLGRYYYSTLRDKENKTTEPHCVKLDTIQDNMDVLIEALEEHYERIAEERAEESQLDIDIKYAKEITKEQAKEITESASKKAYELKDTVSQKASELTQKAGESTEELREKAGSKTDDIKARAREILDNIQKANKVTEEVVSDEDSSKVNEVKDVIENMAKKASEDIDEGTDEGADEKENDNLPFE